MVFSAVGKIVVVGVARSLVVAWIGDSIISIESALESRVSPRKLSSEGYVSWG